MPTVTKYADRNTVVTTGWTNPTNAYADDGTNATAAPAKNSAITSDFGFPALTDGELPVGSTINSVTFEFGWYVSTQDSIATLYSSTYNNDTLDGSETGDATEPLTETMGSKAFSTTPSETDIKTAGRLECRLRARRDSSNTAVTFNLDYVRMVVDYTIAATSYRGYAQAQSYIKSTATAFAQAQAWIKATYPRPLTNYILDSFSRTVSNGWGTADIGGAWSISGSAAYHSVNGSKGLITIPSGSTGSSAYLQTSEDSDSTVSWELDKLPEGAPTYLFLISRYYSTNSTHYECMIAVATDGSFTATIRRYSGGWTNLAFSGNIDTYSVGQVWKTKFRVHGHKLQAKVWNASSTEPASWLLATTDSTLTTGNVSRLYHWASAITNAPLTALFDDYLVTSIDDGTTFAQAQAEISAAGVTTYRGYAQALAQITTPSVSTYRAYAQTQTLIKTTYRGYAQTLAQISVTAAAISRVQSIGSTYSIDAVNPLTLSVSKTITAGNKIIVALGRYTLDDDDEAFSDNLGNTYTKERYVYGAYGNLSMFFYVANITTGGTLTSISCTWPTTKTYSSFIAEEWANVGDITTGGEDYESTTATTTGTWTDPAGITIPANCVVLGAIEPNNPTTTVQPGSASGTPSTTIYEGTGTVAPADPTITFMYTDVVSSEVTGFIGTATWTTASMYTGGAMILHPVGLTTYRGYAQSQVQITSSTVSYNKFAQAKTSICGGSLQGAIDQTDVGGTLDLSNCSYRYEGSFTISKSMTLKGAKIKSTTATRGLIINQASNVIIDDCDVQGTNLGSVYTDATGIYAYRASGIIIQNTSVYDYRYCGIMLVETGEGQLLSNDVQYIGMTATGADNAYGIALTDIGGTYPCRDITVSGNYINWVPNWHGIDDHGGTNLYYYNNEVANTNRALWIGTSSYPHYSQTVRALGNYLHSPAPRDDVRYTYPFNETAVTVLAGATDIIIDDTTVDGWPTGTHLLDQSGGGVTATNWTILNARSSYTSYWRAGQAQVQITPAGIRRGYAQAQAKIITTAQKIGQAQGTIKTTYKSYAQGQAQLKQTYNYSAQSQASIKTTYKSVGQSLSKILVLNSVFGQTQTRIKTFYYGYAQSQAHIKTIYYLHGQSNAQISIALATYRVYAQTQSHIKQYTLNYGQVQTRIKQLYIYTGQSLTIIKQTYKNFGQSNTHIKQTLKSYGQSNTFIVRTITNTAQANTLIGDPNNLYTYIDEISANDSDYIISTLSTGDMYKGLLETHIPKYRVEYVVWYRAWAISSTSPVGHQVAIFQGDTQIANRYSVSLTTTPTTYSYKLTQEEIDSITDYSNLRIVIPGPDDPSYRIIVSWVALQVPSEAGAYINKSFAQARVKIKATTQVYAQAQADIYSLVVTTYKQTGQTQALIGDTTNIYEYIDEQPTYVDTDRIHAPLGSANYYEALIGSYIPAYKMGHIIRFRASRTGGAVDLLVQLRQGTSTVIASTQVSLSTSPTNYNYTLTQAEVDSITDYLDLRLRFTPVNPAADSLVAVQWVELELPPNSIKAGYAQSAGRIKQTYKVTGQSLASIKSTYKVLGQALTYIILSDITKVGQAQARIVQTYLVSGQAQTVVKLTSARTGQAQARIKYTYQSYAQAQSRIKTTYRVYALAEVQIGAATMQSYAQAGATIRVIVFWSKGQALTTTKRTYRVYGQAYTRVFNSVQKYAQAQAKLNAYNVTYTGQAMAYMYTGFNIWVYGQAGTDVINRYPLGQAQATVVIVSARLTQQFIQILLRNSSPQLRSTQQWAEILLKDNPDLRMTQEFAEILLQSGLPNLALTQQYSEVLMRLFPGLRLTQQFVEYLARSNNSTIRYTQQFVEVLIKNGSFSLGQAQAWSKGMPYQQGLALANIYQRLNQPKFGQAMTVVLTKLTYGQARTRIIVIRRPLGQAQALVEHIYRGYGQAMVFVNRREKTALAQCFITGRPSNNPYQNIEEMVNPKTQIYWHDWITIRPNQAAPQPTLAQVKPNYYPNPNLSGIESWVVTNAPSAVSVVSRIPPDNVRTWSAGTFNSNIPGREAWNSSYLYNPSGGSNKVRVGLFNYEHITTINRSTTTIDRIRIFATIHATLVDGYIAVQDPNGIVYTLNKSKHSTFSDLTFYSELTTKPWNSQPWTWEDLDRLSAGVVYPIGGLPGDDQYLYFMWIEVRVINTDPTDLPDFAVPNHAVTHQTTDPVQIEMDQVEGLIDTGIVWKLSTSIKNNTTVIVAEPWKITDIYAESLQVSNININKLKLLSSTAPSNPYNGMLYYDGEAEMVYYYYYGWKMLCIEDTASYRTALVQAHIFAKPTSLANAQALIKDWTGDQVFGQAETFMNRLGVKVYAQSNASVVKTGTARFIPSQTQAYIISPYFLRSWVSFAQAECVIKACCVGVGLCEAYIET